MAKLICTVVSKILLSSAAALQAKQPIKPPFLKRMKRTANRQNVQLYEMYTGAKCEKSPGTATLAAV